MSPMKASRVRQSCLEDLEWLKKLFEEGILSEQEYSEEKEQILSTLKNPSSTQLSQQTYSIHCKNTWVTLTTF